MIFKEKVLLSVMGCGTPEGIPTHAQGELITGVILRTIPILQLVKRNLSSFFQWERYRASIYMVHNNLANRLCTPEICKPLEEHSYHDVL